MDFVTITEKASTQVKSLLNGLPSDVGLRLAVAGGGCSGMTYEIEWDSVVAENDKEFENDGYKVIIDNKSMIYLKGISLDFEDGLNGKGFKFTNPNATSSCGCGESFSMN
ncbi:MAG: iron-sulfur cluster assembly accessory protein [Euryarchaeota archaeon]|jgi:iron-sulfur cluster assembly protein|nr:iron-sulfur cluster assembly accessory protein [Euryarchaeota archaeon]